MSSCREKGALPTVAMPTVAMPAVAMPAVAMPTVAICAGPHGGVVFPAEAKP